MALLSDSASSRTGTPAWLSAPCQLTPCICTGPMSSTIRDPETRNLPEKRRGVSVIDHLAANRLLVLLTTARSSDRAEGSM